MNPIERSPRVRARAEALFAYRKRRISLGVDQLFAVLLMLQWAVALGLALWVSPMTWEGGEGRVHVHVWAALGLGAAIVAAPLVLIRAMPGRAATRYAVAVGQMLMGAMLIHLTGGRIETHFHVFGSLALLAFYPDWRVLVVASAVVAAEHLVRGTYWPRSIFGTDDAGGWRWVEHVAWVAFEDVFLIRSCVLTAREMEQSAWRQAELEDSRNRVEATVSERTAELREAERQTWRAYEDLEGCVRERTAELAAANDRLRGEVVERARVEQELREGERRLHFLADAMPQIVWATDSRGDLEYCNSRWQEYTGQTLDQARGRGWRAMLHGDDLARCLERWDRSLRTGEPYEIEYRMKRADDGVARWHLARALPRRDESGAIVQWVGTCTDIDDQKRAEASLRGHRQDLEVRVRERTAELAAANDSLREEVVERASAEAEARERQRFIESIAEANPAILYLYEPGRRRISWVNSRIRDILGFDSQWVIDRGERILPEIMHPDDAEAVARDPDRYAALADGQTVEWSYRMRHAEGGWRWLSCREIVFRRDQHGRAVEVLGAAEDVTERRRAEEALAASEAEARKLAMVISKTQSIVVIADARGRIEWVNEGFTRLTGYSPEEVIGRKPGSFLQGPHTDPETARMMSDRVRAGEGFRTEVVNYAKDGRPYWLAIDCQPIRDEAGRLTSFIAIETDVTERRQAQEELRRGELRYRSLTEATAAIVWNTPGSGEFVVEQPGWSAFTGQSFEELRGWGWINAIHPDDRVHTARVWSAAVAGLTPYRVEHRLRRHDGEYRHMQVRGVPILDQSGAVCEWVGVHSDIDDQKRAQEATIAARRAAEAASRSKSEFLANMSHEIRTPMNGILGMTELTLDTELLPNQRENLEIVRSSADALLTVINDILDFSKIEAGKLDLDPIPFALRDTLDETLKILALRAHDKGLELVGRVAPALPDAVVGDSGRLRQVLVNLVGNAIKFTERGEVAVSVDVAEEAAPEGQVALHLTIRDTGIGIAPEKLRAIFEPFEQADGSTTRKHGGTGLGLAISAKLVEMMGGRIWVESRPGSGSTFHFTALLGVQPEGAAPHAPADPEGLLGLPILVVDDNGTNRCILEEVLATWGASPTVVDAGPAALEALRGAAGAGHPFRVVLLDGMMPGMDGIQVAEAIAADPALADSRIVLLSSCDPQGDPNRCRELGIVARLTKPVRQSELFEALMGLLPSEPAEGRLAPASPEEPGELPGGSLDILVAEDHVINQKVVTRMLERRGHRVTVVGDGRQALDALARARFDVVLMDVQMPVMDGFEAVAAIRAEERRTGAHIPIIALTAHAMKGDAERCLARGFDSYVPKPIRSQRLLEAIAALFDGPASPSPGATVGGFDRDAALASMDGDEELLREILGLFFEDCPRLLDEAAAAIDAGDSFALRRVAHTIKGTAGHLAASVIVEAARHLEDCGHAPAVAREALWALIAAIERFHESLGELAPEPSPWHAPIHQPEEANPCR